MKTGDIIGIAVVGLIVFGIYSAVNEGSESRDAIDNIQREAAIRDSMNPEVKGWKYETEKDEMRGTVTQRASLQAEDYMPELTPTLWLSRKEDGSKGAMIAGALSEVGGLSCPYNEPFVSVKVDDGAIQKVACQMGMSVALDPVMYDLVDGSAKVMMEVDSSTLGKRQFTFNTAGFKWPDQPRT